ncbi:hypothetical protein P152DRAFT_68355 [Eremomyces bilateralis CBS 781.70]|uniref:Mediator of RNA polymerase II transcription subunit 22 n=1 Tax=Eremomyces bilateralis CBS 781.70 TaxID=1392243 RepID=A0A6G1G052_9PEZI|nr:uncharacterized protein P152DRAFT_68355 [Eremomyces bilateralis CBS 781.70]KAF1811300.1 hypothetical protein P152DRAFT_68355 [Eremomyces bilateralis CBS 781.70]
MDGPIRSASALNDRINRLTKSLVERFENLVALSAVDETDFGASALAGHQIRVESAALVRAGEDILTLTRQMQELWLFGQLNVLERQQSLPSAQENARVVGELLETFARSHYEPAAAKVADG